MSQFDECLKRILKHEGGYVNDSLDRGGRTNLGVTQAVWEEWVGHPVSEADMRNLTVEKVAPLYKKRYWDRASCDLLPKGVSYLVFDFAINAGVGRAIKTLQSTVRSDPDGVIGNQTLARVNAMDAKVLVQQFSEARADFYQGIVARKPDQARFLKGWLNRVEESKLTALADIQEQQPQT